MAYPLKAPNDQITTAYGKRGSYWSCNEDSSGNGVHTGADFACPSNTSMYAVIAGTIRHRQYGSAFGDRAFSISPSAGQPFEKGEVFYAHGNERLADGTEVQVGDFVGRSGARGNVSGPHLHLEYHADSKAMWNCNVHDDPQPVLDHQAVDHGPVFLSKLAYGQKDSDSVLRLQMHLNDHSLEGGQRLDLSGNYLDQTDEEVRLCQQQHGFGSDPAKASSVGPSQAAHLFSGCACVVTDDLGTPEPPVVEPPPLTGETITFPLGIEYHYSGKPTGTLSFSGSYKKLDVSAWAPKKDGLTFGMLYLNLAGEGEVKVRLVRDPADYTAYQTYYIKSGDHFLLTHVWFESGEGGRKLWWEMVSADGHTFVAETRYAKFVTIPWEVTIVMTAAVATVSAARAGAKRLASWLGV